jgi:hypothetical protein
MIRLRQILAVVVMMFWIVPANAFCLTCNGPSLFDNLQPSFGHGPTGDADLDRAVKLCDEHARQSNVVYPEGGAPRAFEEGWDSCSWVMQAWDRSEEARHEAAAREQASRDKAWIDEYAKGLHK